MRRELPENHLRGHVLSAAAERVGQRVARHVLFRKPEIGDLDVPVHIDQQVLWLQVPVDDALLVQVLEAVQDFQEVEFGLFLRDSFH